MPLTIAQQLAAIDAKIAELVETPEVDYVDGDVSVKAGQKMLQLLAARKALLEQPTEATFESIYFEDCIDEFGSRRS